MNTEDIILKLNELSKQLDTPKSERIEMVKSVTDCKSTFC